MRHALYELTRGKFTLDCMARQEAGEDHLYLHVLVANGLERVSQRHDNLLQLTAVGVGRHVRGLLGTDLHSRDQQVGQHLRRSTSVSVSSRR